MYADHRGQWSQRVRYGVLASVYPAQIVFKSPARAWQWLTDLFAERNGLRNEIAQLRDSQRQLQMANLHMQSLEAENVQLRNMRDQLPPLVRRYILAEVISVETTAARQRVIVNRGASDGVHLNQAAIDGNGIVGQVASVGPWSAEIILITDPQHALPVQVQRNQLRTIAVGSGDSDEILLKYLAVNSDVKSGDVLLSSGLGGVYPAGYPVGTVIGVVREQNQLLAQVRARPVAHVDRVRELMLVDFNPGNPAAPVATGNLATTNPGASKNAPPAATPANEHPAAVEP